MDILVGLAVAGAASYIWLRGHWFGWLVVGAALALTSNTWLLAFGVPDDAPGSPSIWARAAVVFLLCGIPCLLRTAARQPSLGGRV